MLHISCIFTAWSRLDMWQFFLHFYSIYYVLLQAITIAGETRDSDQLSVAQSAELNSILTSQLDSIYQKLVNIVLIVEYIKDWGSILVNDTYKYRYVLNFGSFLTTFQSEIHVLTVGSEEKTVNLVPIPNKYEMSLCMLYCNSHFLKVSISSTFNALIFHMKGLCAAFL